MDLSKRTRFASTIELVKANVPEGSTILDLGVDNPVAELMRKEGYTVINTRGENLDDEFNPEEYGAFDAVTAFEIFEHLLAPYNVLKKLSGTRLIATVPLKLWFKEAYWNDNDPWDCHYHEFEIKQFDHLLKRCDWSIEKSGTWADKNNKLGIRPLLRRLYPRYYYVVADKA